MAGCFSLDQNLNFSVSYNKIGSCGIQAVQQAHVKSLILPVAVNSRQTHT